MVGTAESQGTFTISPHTAAQTMRRFRMPDPQMYILQMVSTAVYSSVTRLHIKSKPRALEYYFEGLEIPKEELRILDTFLFPTVDAPEHLVELAVGIETALNFAEEIRVETFSSEACWRLVINPRTVRLEELKDLTVERAVSRVSVRKKREVSQLWKANRHAELDWLYACRHAFIPILVDGEPLETSPFPPLPEKTILWANIGLDSQLVEASELFPEESPPALTTEHPSIIGYLALLPREQANKQGLLIIHRGLVVHRPLADLGLQVLCGVLHCDSLKKDLSHANFVEDATFRELTDFLRKLGIALVTEFCRDLAQHRISWKHLWGPVTNLLRDGQLTESQDEVIRAWADQVYELGESQSPFSGVQKARFLESEGRELEAECLRWELVKRLQEEALLCFDKGKLNRLPERCEALHALSLDLKSGHAESLFLASCFLQCLLDLPFELNPDLEDEDPLTLHRMALIRRWKGDLTGAIELHLMALQHDDADALIRGWGIRYCAELEFSQGRYDQADKLYDFAEEELPKQRDLWEERAYFKRFMGQEQSAESLAYLRRSVGGVELDSFVNWLLVEEVKKHGRGVFSRSELAALQTKSAYLKWKKLSGEGEQSKIEATLKEGLDLEGWTSREELIQQKIAAVESAELAFGPTYLYTRFCRRRCVYQVHRLGAEDQAEHLQCRGHLLEHLRMILTSLDN